MQKRFYITSPFDNKITEVLVTKRKYSNDRIALELIDTEDGIPYANATVNLPDVLLEENEVLIKDYSENEGILDFLLTNNIVKLTGKGVQSGFAWIPVCILNPESEWGTTPVNTPITDEEPTYTEQKITDTEKVGKTCYEIKGYKIWADSYQEALYVLQLIESF